MNTKYTSLIDAALDIDVEKLVSMINALRDGASIDDARRIAAPGVRGRLEQRRTDRKLRPIGGAFSFSDPHLSPPKPLPMSPPAPTPPTFHHATTTAPQFSLST